MFTPIKEYNCIIDEINQILQKENKNQSLENSIFSLKKNDEIDEQTNKIDKIDDIEQTVEIDKIDDIEQTVKINKIDDTEQIEKTNQS